MIIDRTRALLAGAIGAVILLAVGFAVGRTADNSSTDAAPTGEPELAGDGLPAGPTGIDDGVPVGFARSEDGAVAAAVSWLPWLLSTPVSEGPPGINAVLADGVDPLFDEATTRRVQFAPIAARVTDISSNAATVEVFGPELNGDVGEDLTGAFLAVPVDLSWDEAAGDWRISHIQETDLVVDPPFSPTDLDGYRMVRSYGAVVGGDLVEVVPGE